MPGDKDYYPDTFLKNPMHGDEVQIYKAFNRRMLSEIHKDAKRHFPGIDLRKAWGVHKQLHGRYLAEGTIGGKYRSWNGRAEDSAHAKYQAWRSILPADDLS